MSGIFKHTHSSKKRLLPSDKGDFWLMWGNGRGKNYGVNYGLGIALLCLTASHVFAQVDPMQINSLIAQAIQTHPKVGAARADQQATTEGITAAKLGFFPTPSISSGYDKNEGMISKAAIRQPLWTGGKLTASVNQAIYDDKAASAYIYEQQNIVAKSTVDIWQSYIYSVALQQLYTENIKRLREFEAMMQRRVSQGVSAKIELDLITNRVLQDQNSWQGAIEQQRIAEARLAQLIGEPVSARKGQYVPLNIMAKSAKQQAVSFEQMAFDTQTLNNPSVIKEQYQIEAAKQQVKIQESSRYPTVYAQYEDTYYHKTHDNNGQFSMGLTYDPGAGFSNMALARASQARVQSLIQSQEAARRTVIEDIQTQYQQFVSAKDQELSLVAAVAGAGIVVESYSRQFIAGRKTWLEVLNAVREQAQYQQQLLQVQSQLVANFYKLQVDFGVMPWQQNPNIELNAAVPEYHPYAEFKDWAKRQPVAISQKIATLSNNIAPNKPVSPTVIPTPAATTATTQTTTQNDTKTDTANNQSVSEKTISDKAIIENAPEKTGEVVPETGDAVTATPVPEAPIIQAPVIQAPVIQAPVIQTPVAPTAMPLVQTPISAPPSNTQEKTNPIKP